MVTNSRSFLPFTSSSGALMTNQVFSLDTNAQDLQLLLNFSNKDAIFLGSFGPSNFMN